jgi:hypothetical protein
MLNGTRYKIARTFRLDHIKARYPSLFVSSSLLPSLAMSFMPVIPDSAPRSISPLVSSEKEKNPAPKSQGQKIKTWEVMAMNEKRKHAKHAIHLSLLISYSRWTNPARPNVLFLVEVLDGGYDLEEREREREREPRLSFHKSEMIRF